MFNVLFAVVIAVAGFSGCVTRTTVKSMIDDAVVEQEMVDQSRLATLDDLKKEEQDCKRRLKAHGKSSKHSTYKEHGSVGYTLDQQLKKELDWMK